MPKLADPKGSWTAVWAFGGEMGGGANTEFWVGEGPGDADGGGVSSHKRSLTGSGGGGGAENGEAPFVRIDGGTRLWGRVAGTSLPANLP